MLPESKLTKSQEKIVVKIEGKEPDLEAARRCAIWPEAALEDFTEEKLLARLPALMQGFKAAVEALGFEY